MEYKEIFPIVLGIKKLEHIPDLYINDCIKYIKNLKYDSNANSNDHLTCEQQLLDGQLFTPLKTEILKNSLLYAKKLGITVENLQISNSWGYIINSNNKLYNSHIHANSLLSGVFYLTQGAPLEFRSNFYKNLFFETQPTNLEQQNLHHYQTPIKQKQLLLFPSFLSHSVSPHISNNERISIAFNIIPKGEFGSPYQKLYL